MSSPSTICPNDPVSQAVLSSARHSGRTPVPLLSTSYDISISGGLANVVAKRRFHNGETLSIEAVATFPLPVHAVLHGLEAKIGDRVVKAVAKQRNDARATYEDAIDRGKTAVLHEELLKGVHMLSVGHVPPGTEIEVTARFALALSFIGGRVLLRIPTTVGDVYGSSSLPDCDELTHGGTLLAGDVKVACDSGTPVLLGGCLVDGAARVWLDAPIVIEVKDWESRDVIGAGADGKPLVLSIRPAAVASANLDAAILVDHSGSMGEPAARNARLTKHAAVLLGLTEASADLTESDRLNLWEFDTDVADLGTAHASTWRSLVHVLSPPQGGTEIGRAIDRLLAQRPVRDVVLITDGKSHALDVQRLAATGVRFTVVLIGEDSLEANVGHLASLSGGEIFVPVGADVAPAVRSALASLRLSRAAISEWAATSGKADESATRTVSPIAAHRSGMAIVASWNTAAPSSADTAMARAAGAYAASLRLARLPQADAAALAEQEGLVTHLTSLVLVDEQGVAQSGIPAMRKVALPSPATVATAHPAAIAMHAAPVACSYAFAPSRADTCDFMAPSRSPAMASVKRSISTHDEDSRRRALDSLRRKRAAAASASASEVASDAAEASQMKSLAHLVRLVDWRSEGQKLADGNMIGLDSEVADAIDAAAAYGAVRRLAKRLGLQPRMLVIALLARAAAKHDRHADRVARAILAKARTKDIAPLAERLGL